MIDTFLFFHFNARNDIPVVYSWRSLTEPVLHKIDDVDMFDRLKNPAKWTLLSPTFVCIAAARFQSTRTFNKSENSFIGLTL